jgi:hypothetical protein
VLTLVLGACGGGTGHFAAPATTTTAPPVTTPVRAATTTTAPGPWSATPVAPGIQERRVEAAGGASLVIRFDDPMQQEALRTVEEALLVARQDLGDSGPLVVHVYSSAEAFVAGHDARSQQKAQQDVDSGATANTNSAGIWIYGPRFVDRDTSARRLIVVHEYFHTVQLSLSMERGARPPEWLAEGSARYFETRVGADHGYTDFDRRRDLDIRQSRALEPLQTYEGRGGRLDAGEAYTLGFLASDYLVKAKGVDALKRDLWIQMRLTADWQTAFANVFGVSTDQFYADFEAYRATL